MLTDVCTQVTQLHRSSVAYPRATIAVWLDFASTDAANDADWSVQSSHLQVHIRDGRRKQLVKAVRLLRNSLIGILQYNYILNSTYGSKFVHTIFQCG
jgi:hypothetical protein